VCLENNQLNLPAVAEYGNLCAIKAILNTALAG
jgi:hypothetical protein